MDLDNKEIDNKNVDINGEMYSRSACLMYLFFIITISIITNILITQYGADGDKLREDAKNSQRFNFKTSYAKRGNIFDYKDRLLSTSIPNYHIFMDFKAQGLPDSVFNNEVGDLAKSLSSFFKDKSAKVYKDSLVSWHKRGLRYKRISPRRINYLELKEVLDFPIYNRGRNRGGFILDTLNVRFFPNGNLAQRTIGRKNDTGTNYGIEGYFDEDLKGIDGVVATKKISGNFWMPIEDERNVDPVDGCDVVSTIDIEVQRVAEDALREQLTKNEALWGTAILMEVETGEIRAIANLSQGEKDKSKYYEDGNHAVAKNMEPGSTFKLVSLMALLEDIKISIDTKFDTEGGIIRIGKATIRDSHNGGYGVISLRKCFEVSANTCFTKAIHKYYSSDPNKFVDYLEDLKFMEPFDLQVAGERMPLIRRPNDRYWDGTTLTMMAYGYALMMTPLRTLSMYNAIANGGELVAPRLVTEVRDSKGNTVKTFPKKVMKESVCSDETLKEIKLSLEGVVNEGTARYVLLNDNYKVAGKTGTAQVAKGRYGYNVNGGKYYLATIVGYFPADKPKYSCIVAIETFHTPGSGKTYYGGTLSGPVFRAIADKVYSLTPEWVDVIDKPELKKSISLPREVDTSLPSITRGLATHNNVVKDKFTTPVVEIEDSIKIDNEGVKNVVGMPLRDALYLLESQKLEVSFSGKGLVTEQSLVPGAEFIQGDTIKLILKY
ncbi:MAG: penicillin-binding protein [Rikenellaceae bacterium]